MGLDFLFLGGEKKSIEYNSNSINSINSTFFSGADPTPYSNYKYKARVPLGLLFFETSPWILRPYRNPNQQANSH